MQHSNNTKPVALITGASRGIGFEIARHFIAAGYRIAICGTRTETITAAANDLSKEYADAEVLPLTVNVTDNNAIVAMIKDIISNYNRLDVLVNNAGITRDKLIMRMKDDDWQAVIDTNLSSVFYAAKAAIRPMMRARFGRIINISSVVASTGNAGQVNYCASKGGVEAMSRALAREVASRGITINSVAPGFIETDMTDDLSAEAKKKLISDIPLQRMGKPADIAAAVLFLASENAAYITGQVLHVNGGMSM
ncbi:MAG: 3-oxoacyl-ACP reductase FabG [Mariprofundales bacterium]